METKAKEFVKERKAILDREVEKLPNDRTNDAASGLLVVQILTYNTLNEILYHLRKLTDGR